MSPMGDLELRFVHADSLRRLKNKTSEDPSALHPQENLLALEEPEERPLSPAKMPATMISEATGGGKARARPPKRACAVKSKLRNFEDM
jgi:hypothetical protein